MNVAIVLVRGCDAGAFEYGLNSPNTTSLFVCNDPAVPPAITPNNDSMNRLLWIHNRRFLRRVSIRTVVFNTHPVNTHPHTVRGVKYTVVKKSIRTLAILAVSPWNVIESSCGFYHACISFVECQRVDPLPKKINTSKK